MASGSVILLTGAPASGKSMVARALVSRATPLHRLGVGELLLRLKRKQHPTLTYEELRALSATVVSASDVRELDAAIVEEASRLRLSTNVLIDSHAVTREAFGFRATPFHLEHVRQLALDAVIVMHCDPEETVRRIEHDSGGRIAVTTSQAQRHTHLQDTLALVYGVACGCLVFFIESNREPDILADEIVDLLARSGLPIRPNP